MKTKWWIPRPSGSMVPTGGYLGTHGTVGNVCRHFWLLQWGGGFSWHIVVVVARDSAEQPSKHGTDPNTKRCPAWNVQSAEVGKGHPGWRPAWGQEEVLFQPQTPPILDDLGLQWLEAGFRFQARDWSQAVAGRTLNPSCLTRGQWQDPGPLTL